MSADPNAQSEIVELPRADGAARDGVGEEDNPIPAWFNVSFYGMLIVGVLYLLFYTLSGWSQASQYEAEVARFEEYYAPMRKEIVAANPLRGDAAAIAAGKQTFATICSACHKPDATGLIGPSLIDPYWKYGSSDADRFESVSKGRPGGMPPWGVQLSDDQVWQVLAYADTLPKRSEPGVGSPEYDAAAAAAASAP
jgi:cytochrome c oxidase cbb3-type subunit 3